MFGRSAEELTPLHSSRNSVQRVRYMWPWRASYPIWDENVRSLRHHVSFAPIINETYPSRIFQRSTSLNSTQEVAMDRYGSIDGYAAGDTRANNIILYDSQLTLCTARPYQLDREGSLQGSPNH
jgi:hypothetical protein